MRAEYYPADAYERLFRAMQGDNVLALRVALETGLRIGDVLSLTRWDLSSGGVSFVAEKTGKAGFVRLSPVLYRKLCARANVGVGWLFPSPTKPYKHRTRQAVWTDIKKARARVNVPQHITPHSTRKTFAADLFHSSGLDAVQAALQHDSIATSMIYAYSDKMVDIPVDIIDYEKLADMVTARIMRILHEKNIF